MWTSQQRCMYLWMLLLNAHNLRWTLATLCSYLWTIPLITSNLDFAYNICLSSAHQCYLFFSFGKFVYVYSILLIASNNEGICFHYAVGVLSCCNFSTLNLSAMVVLIVVLNNGVYIIFLHLFCVKKHMTCINYWKE